MAQGRVQWRALFNTEINLRVSFLINWTTKSFWTRSLPHEILGWTESFCVFQMKSQSFFFKYLQHLINYIISIACYYLLPTCHKLFNYGFVKTSWFAYVISSKTQKLSVQPNNSFFIYQSMPVCVRLPAQNLRPVFFVCTN
jgi:hypothetical protein